MKSPYNEDIRAKAMATCNVYKRNAKKLKRASSQRLNDIGCYWCKKGLLD